VEIDEATGPNVFPRRLSASASPRFSVGDRKSRLHTRNPYGTTQSPFLFPLFLLYHTLLHLLGPFILFPSFSPIQFSSTIESWIQSSVILDSFFYVVLRLYTPLGVRPGCTPPFFPYRPWTPNL
jgi:hypothetical protein